MKWTLEHKCSFLYLISLIGIQVVVICIFAFCPYYFVKNYENTSANKIIIFSIWGSFVLINAFYGGALTMFFVSEITIPFNDIRDVLKNFPAWNIIFMNGNDVYFKTWAIQVSLKTFSTIFKDFLRMNKN